MDDNMHHISVDRDGIVSAGQAAHHVVDGLAKERVWDGKTITQPGIYVGIPLEEYHGNRNLFDGPSVSKSALKHLIPAHGGSPKAFWGRWGWNPNRIAPKTSDALDFGRALHALLLGDEVFDEKFIVRPDTYPDSKTGAAKPWHGASSWCKEWLDEHSHLTVLSSDQIEMIRRMREDASQNHLVKLGVLSGRVERTMAYQCPETGIWVKARPDVIPTGDGVFADLKSVASMEEDFIERQLGDAGYYLQASMLRMVCRALGVPFDTFVLLYVLKDDVPDTAHVELSVHDIDRGEKVVRWCLRTIRRCLDAGEWPGANPFNAGERPAQMKPWTKEALDRSLQETAA